MDRVPGGNGNNSNELLAQLKRKRDLLSTKLAEEGTRMKEHPAVSGSSASPGGMTLLSRYQNELASVEEKIFELDNTLMDEAAGIFTSEHNDMQPRGRIRSPPRDNSRRKRSRSRENGSSSSDRQHRRDEKEHQRAVGPALAKKKSKSTAKKIRDLERSKNHRRLGKNKRGEKTDHRQMADDSSHHPVAAVPPPRHESREIKKGGPETTPARNEKRAARNKARVKKFREAADMRRRAKQSHGASPDGPKKFDYV